MLKRAFNSSAVRRAIVKLDTELTKNYANVEKANTADFTSGTYTHRIGQHVVIFKPALNATQNAVAHDDMWRLHYDAEARTVSPLNGWSFTTATPTSPLVGFQTAEDAARFAKNQGLSFTIIPDQTATFKKKSYSDNFRWRGEPKKEESF